MALMNNGPDGASNSRYRQRMLRRRDLQENTLRKTYNRNTSRVQPHKALVDDLGMDGD